MPEGLIWDSDDSDIPITGAIPDTAGDDSMDQNSYLYFFIDNSFMPVINTFTLEVIDVEPEAPTAPMLTFALGRSIPNNTILPEFGNNIRADLKPIAANLDVFPNGYTPTFEYTLMGLDADGTTVTELPAWLNFDPATRVLSNKNNLPVAGESFQVRYTASEGAGRDTAFVDFTINVIVDHRPEPPTFIGGGYMFNVGDRLPQTGGGEEVLPSFTIEGDDDGLTLIHSLTDANGNPLNPANTLVGGLMYDSSSRTIHGEIMGTADFDDSSVTTYTYSATEMAPQPAGQMVDTGETTFTITITDELPMFASDNNTITVDNAIVGSAFTTDALPEVVKDTISGITIGTIGTGMITYTVTQADDTPRPGWLNFNAETRVLSGTPPAVLTGADSMFAYTATDEDMDVANIPFTITVALDPELMAPTIQPLVYVVGMDLQPISEDLDPFTGENGMLTYTLSNTQELMDEFGLMFDADNQMITGDILADTSANQNVALRTFTYTATDDDNTPDPAVSDDDTASTDFTIQIIDPRPVAPSGNLNRPFNLNSMDISYTLPAFMTNVDDNDAVTTPTLTYTVTEDEDTPRPAWLNFNAKTRELSGMLPAEIVDGSTVDLTYTATEDGGADTLSEDFTLSFTAQDIPLAPPTTIPDGGYTFNAGDNLTDNPIELPDFIGGSRPLTYSLSPAFPDGLGLSFNSNPDSREITGMIPNTERDDSVPATTYTYSATDDEATAMVSFTITVTDTNITIPEDAQVYRRAPGDDENITLAEFTGGTAPLMYTLNTTPNLPAGLSASSNFSTSRIITVDLLETAATMPATEYTYTAMDAEGDMESATFTIAITDVPSLNEATASAIPSVGANIALVATQAISSRVELALNGLSSGIDIRTLDGPSLRLNPQQQNGGSGLPVRFGVWYSAASDSLSDTRGDVTWSGDTDTTNLGFDVGFDISPDISLVVGILQNSASTSASYRNTGGDSAGTLSVDLDSTAFYVGLGYDWLDAWFASGSADSTLNDSQIEMGIPASFSYQTIGLTVAFEVIDSFNIGGKVESLTSDLSLAAMADDNYMGLSTDSSQLRTAFVANYQLKLGENANGLLIPKFEFGFRDLSLGSSISGPTTAVGGSAMETGFGIDYLQRAWGLTVGLDIRSISVENYSSDSTQYQIRWESGNYGNGISFQLTPHSVSETLGGIDSLYSGGYNQYQSVLERQRGGNNAADTKGMDFEVGYGIASGYGTVTPYLKTTNYRGSGNRAQEFGIRYQTLQGLELTLTAERSLTPQTIQSPFAQFGLPPLTFMQQEQSLSLNTRYSF